MDFQNFLSRDIKMRHLRVLLAIDQLGQLAKVAAMLHVSQPAVSKTLAEIENGVGLKLFERTAHRLVANEFGEAMIRAASDIMNSLQRASAELNVRSRGIAESLVIGTMPFGALSFVSQAIALDPRVREGLSVSVIEGATEALMPQLLADRIQLLIGRFRRQMPDSVTVYPLYVESVRFAIAPHHPIARKTSVTWEGLMQFPWVLPPPGHLTRSSFERAVRNAGLTVPTWVINSTMADLGLGLLKQHDAVVLMMSRQIQFLERLGLAQALPPSPADRLEMIVEVSAFVSRQRETQTGIQSLLGSLRAAVASAPSS